MKASQLLRIGFTDGVKEWLRWTAPISGSAGRAMVSTHWNDLYLNTKLPRGWMRSARARENRRVRREALALLRSSAFFPHARFPAPFYTFFLASSDTVAKKFERTDLRKQARMLEASIYKLTNG